MIELAIFVAVGLALLLVMFWLARDRGARRGTSAAEARIPIEELFPLHSRHFPQVRQALSADDRDYLKRRASSGLRREALATRRQVVQEYLAGLAKDFSRLDRLGRTVARLSPQLNRRLESERVWLGLRFWGLYLLVRLGVRTVRPTVWPLERLTGLVGSLAAEIEAAMAAFEQAPTARLGSNLTA